MSECHSINSSASMGPSPCSVAFVGHARALLTRSSLACRSCEATPHKLQILCKIAHCNEIAIGSPTTRKQFFRFSKACRYNERAKVPKAGLQIPSSRMVLLVTSVSGYDSEEMRDPYVLSIHDLVAAMEPPSRPLLLAVLGQVSEIMPRCRIPRHDSNVRR